MRAEPRGRPSTPPSDLPAPYRSPWKRLGEDLEAVGADLVLRGRELWRRNGEGNLWRPPFWPRTVAASFWPLVLAAVLVVGLVVGLGSRRGAPPPVPGAEGERAGASAEPAPSLEPEEPLLPPPGIAPPSTDTRSNSGEAEPATGDL